MSSHPRTPPEVHRSELDLQCQRLVADRRHREACNLIAVTLGPELRGYCRGVMACENAGDDLYQDVLEGVWTGLPSFLFACSVRTWVYAIAHHMVLGRFRRYSRHKVVRLDTDQAAALPDQSLSVQLAQAEQRERVAALRESLSAEEREIIILRTEREMGFREIATVLQITESAARQRYLRARRRLELLLSRAD